MEHQRSKIKSNFTSISNSIIRDRSISFEARALLFEIISRPVNWKIIMNTFTGIKCGITRVRRMFKELEKAGYLYRHQIRNDAGNRIVDNLWISSDIPLSKPEWKALKEQKSFLDAGFVKVRKPLTVRNITLLNKDCFKKERKAEAIEETGSIDDKKLICSAFFKNSAFLGGDKIIGAELTPNQIIFIDSEIKTLAADKNLDYDVLVNMVSYVILDKNQFKKCGDDFMLKLNTVKKQIRTGKLGGLKNSCKPKNNYKSEIQKKINDLKCQIQSAIINRNESSKMMKNFKIHTVEIKKVELDFNGYDAAILRENKKIVEFNEEILQTQIKLNSLLNTS
jgi:hypothetical protein